MGWWSADKRRRGRIAAKKTNRGPVLGDVPADLMSDAIEKIKAEYRAVHGREPTKVELELCWKFCTQKPWKGRKAMRVSHGRY